MLHCRSAGQAATDSTCSCTNAASAPRPCSSPLVQAGLQAKLEEAAQAAQEAQGALAAARTAAERKEAEHAAQLADANKKAGASVRGWAAARCGSEGGGTWCVR